VHRCVNIIVAYETTTNDTDIYNKKFKSSYIY
jgi:hypothetical protein